MGQPKSIAKQNVASPNRTTVSDKMPTGARQKKSQLRTPGPPGGAEALKMPAKHPHLPQLRVDPTDGKAYPLDEFLEFYGADEGQRRWATAGQQPASAGIFRFCVSIKYLSFYQPVLLH